jgi:hypothetical protein
VCLRRDRRLFTLLALLLVVFPLPFFVLHVSHWWAARYFTPQLPVFALAAGLGAGAAARALFRRRPAAETAVAGVLALALAGTAFLGGGRVFGGDLDRGMPHFGMREAAREVAQAAAPGDVVVFAPHPAERWYPRSIFSYYLGTDSRLPSGTVRLENCDDPACVRKWLESRPENTVWVVTPPPDQLRRMARVVRKKPEIQGISGVLRLFCPPPRALGESLLWTRLPGNAEGGQTALAEPLRLFPLEKGTASLRLEAGAEVSGEGDGALVVSVPADAPPEGRPAPTAWLHLSRAAGTACAEAETLLLTFDLRCDGVTPGGNPARTGRVIVAGPDGFWKDAYFISGSCDWREETVVLTRGGEFPEAAGGVRIGFGNRGGTGTFQVRNVRLWPLPPEGEAQP